MTQRGTRRPLVRFNYTQITTTPYTITESALFSGYNIFGVNVASAASIVLPNNIASNVIIAIKDESGSAGSNNITLTIS